MIRQFNIMVIYRDYYRILSMRYTVCQYEKLTKAYTISSLTAHETLWTVSKILPPGGRQQPK